MAKECLTDFTARLRDNGVANDLVEEITTRIISDKLQAVSDAAQTYHLNNPTTRSSFADKLSAMTNRCYGVSTAVSGLRQGTHEDMIFNGVDQLLMDLIESAERLERDHEALLLSGNKKTSE